MRLKSIEIQGFKSFPDKTKLTFEKDITAVIGPNGSGKSNISDSVRWVLGEQSSKSLRGLKMEDVIFGGTAVRKPMGFAEVSLTLDNADRTLDFDGDEVTITRRYFRSGESEYKINGAAVRLKDIHELFMDTGLGRDGYSMIGQGRIDEIVGSKSDERRDIFEEAAGISKYRYRKLDAERKLAHAEENLVRLRDILQELEGRVGPLEEQSKKAQAFLEYSEEKKELEIGLWVRTLQQSTELLREQDYKITLAQAQYDQVTRELTDIEAQSEISLQDSQRITVQMDEVRRQAAKSEEQAAQTNSEIAVLENTILHNGETIARLQRDIADIDSDDQTADGRIAALQQTVEAVLQQRQQAADGLEQLLLQLHALADDSGSYSKQIEEKNRALNELSASVAEQQVVLARAQTSKAEIQTRMTEIDDVLQTLEQTLQQAAQEMQAVTADLTDAQQRITECENVVNGHALMLQTRQQKLQKHKEELERRRLDIDEKRRRAQILEDLEKNMEGFSYAVKAVSKAAKHGTLRGIHGPVSRLIKVPGKYAAAIETALGAAMQNIVVDSENDAKRAISYLKNANAGRATFLPLTAVKGNSLREKGVSDCAGFIGMAAQLITYDPAYEQIVSSLLGRTVVSQDMDTAVETAKKFGYRFRVVTLDGQVVNAGGSLTGGSHAKNAGLLNRAAKIAELRAEAEQMQAALDADMQRYKQDAEDLTKREAQMQAAQSELAVAHEDQIRLQSELRRLTEQHNTTDADLQRLRQQKQEAAKRDTGFDQQVRQAMQQMDAAHQQKNELEQALALLTGGRDQLADKRDALSKQVSDVKLQIIGYDKDVAMHRQSIEQLQASKTDQQARVQNLQAEIDEYAQKNQQLQQKITQLQQMRDGFSSSSEDFEQQMQALNRRRGELEQQVVTLRAREKDLSAEKEKNNGELARLTARRENMEKEYDEIVAKLFDEYELTRSQAEEIGVPVSDEKAASRRLNELKQRIRQLGSVNVAAIEEYKEVSERYTFLRAQIADVQKAKEELYKLIQSLTDKMKTLFVQRFDAISRHFTEVFKELFGGGTAQLKLSDPANVLETGIEIIAQPPGKNISIIEQLSGGEKALIAVAIYFAIMKVNPPPFCLLDEVEAALDEVNVDRFAAYLRRMSHDTQFIIITHRRGTMEEADVLYGVTMQEKGVSKLLSIDVSQIESTLSEHVRR